MEYNPPPWLTAFLDRLDDIQDEITKTKKELLDTVYQMALDERKRAEQPPQRRIPTITRRRPRPQRRLQDNDDGYCVDGDEP